MTHSASTMSYFHSWSISAPGFEDTLYRLRHTPLTEDTTHHCINSNHGKEVWRCQDGQRTFAYKIQGASPKTRYLFQPSLPAREYRNYQIVHELGIPCPDVLAVGDVRHCFILTETFIVTSFLDGTVDGRNFKAGHILEGALHETMMRFCHAHLAYAARLHDAGYFHYAFHPRNLLRKPAADGQPEAYFWIDLPRMSPVPKGKEVWAYAKDLHSLIRDITMTREDEQELIESYASHRTTPCPTVQKLHDAVDLQK